MTRDQWVSFVQREATQYAERLHWASGRRFSAEDKEDFVSRMVIWILENHERFDPRRGSAIQFVQTAMTGRAIEMQRHAARRVTLVGEAREVLDYTVDETAEEAALEFVRNDQAQERLERFVNASIERALCVQNRGRILRLAVHVLYTIQRRRWTPAHEELGIGATADELHHMRCLHDDRLRLLVLWDWNLEEAIEALRKVIVFALRVHVHPHAYDDGYVVSACERLVAGLARRVDKRDE